MNLTLFFFSRQKNYSALYHLSTTMTTSPRTRSLSLFHCALFTHSQHASQAGLLIFAFPFFLSILYGLTKQQKGGKENAIVRFFVLFFILQKAHGGRIQEGVHLWIIFLFFYLFVSRVLGGVKKKRVHLLLSVSLFLSSLHMRFVVDAVGVCLPVFSNIICMRAVFPSIC